MEQTPDYSRCSHRELRDVAARINREKYPDRYALVLRELERREAADERAPRDFARRPFTSSDALTLLLFWVGGIAVGTLASGLLFSLIDPPSGPNYGDGVGWSYAMLLCAFVGAIIGGVVGLCRGVIKVRET